MQIQEALDCMPSLLLLDDLHLICPAPGDAPGEAPDSASASSSAVVVEWLCDVMDSFRPPAKPALPGMHSSHLPSQLLPSGLVPTKYEYRLHCLWEVKSLSNTILVAEHGSNMIANDKQALCLGQ